ncbi:MAG TPA: hypothetical protein PKA77_13680 [Chitinophagaceae bacterium]|jgi:uncharacterized membrane protein|nr:hypothetical protein [Chitinophagaceae bacterium]HMU59213.1 hypothetical protein [Chitinophagaceae bacterium]
MKRIQLIQYGIVVIGLIFGYKFFESIFSAIIPLLFSFDGQFSGDIEFLGPLIFAIILYGIAFVLLIRNSNQIATMLNKNAENETLEIKVGKKALLHVILLSMCLITIILSIPDIIIYLFEAFKNDIGRRNPDSVSIDFVRKPAFYVALLKAVTASVALAYSKEISGWFIRRTEADDLVFDSTPQKD